MVRIPDPEEPVSLEQVRADLERYLSSWSPQEQPLRRALEALVEQALSCTATSLSLVPRPGVSYSLRFGLEPPPPGRRRPVFLLVDVVEAAEERFLSVCFYAEEVDDPRELGEVIPQGLLGEDGYCFDLDREGAADPQMVDYLCRRIAVAHARARGDEAS